MNAVFRLIQPYYSTGRNLATDNFLTSLNLVRQGKNAELNSTNTINRPNSKVLHSSEKREQKYSGKIAKHNGIALMSYQANK